MFECQKLPPPSTQGQAHLFLASPSLFLPKWLVSWWLISRSVLAVFLDFQQPEEVIDMASGASSQWEQPCMIPLNSLELLDEYLQRIYKGFLGFFSFACPWQMC